MVFISGSGCEAVDNPKILFRVHALQRMFERKIPARKVRQALDAGETIEDYSSEMPEPSRLILGFQGRRPFHVLTSEDPEAKEINIITVYIADPGKWNKEFRNRRS